MAQFDVTYPDGTQKLEEQSDCSTVEQFRNCRFGSCDSSQVKVELVVDKSPETKKSTKK